jgi:hypothetical protein
MHLKQKETNENIPVSHIASHTEGFSPAELTSIWDEAGLIAASKQRSKYGPKIFCEAITRYTYSIIIGWRWIMKNNLLSRIFNKIRNKHSVDERSSNNDPLREFIYLDEVSLTRLIASQNGVIAEEIKKNNQSLMESGGNVTNEHEAPVGSNVMGSVKSGLSVSANFKASSTQAVETTFKLVAQSRFKQFIEETSVAKSIISTHALRAMDGNTVSDRGITASTGLRGKLFELQISRQSLISYSV